MPMSEKIVQRMRQNTAAYCAPARVKTVQEKVMRTLAARPVLVTLGGSAKRGSISTRFITRGAR